MIISAEPSTELLDKGSQVSVGQMQKPAHRSRVETDANRSSEDFAVRWKLLLKKIGMLPQVSPEDMQPTEAGEPSRELSDESQLKRSGSGADVGSALECSKPANLPAEDDQVLLVATNSNKTLVRLRSMARHHPAALAGVAGEPGTSGQQALHMSVAEHIDTRRRGKPASHANLVIEQRKGVEGLTGLNSAALSDWPRSIVGPTQVRSRTEDFVSAKFSFGRGQDSQDSNGAPSRNTVAQVEQDIAPMPTRSFNGKPEQVAPDAQNATELGVAAKMPTTMTGTPAEGGLDQPETTEGGAQITTSQVASESVRSSSSDSMLQLIEPRNGAGASRREGEPAADQWNSAGDSLSSVNPLSGKLSAHPLTLSTHPSAHDLSRGVSKDANGKLSEPSAPATSMQGDSIVNSLRNSFQNSEIEIPGKLHSRFSAESRGEQPNTIEALDGSLNTAGARWIRAGGHGAEAGYHDPSLGWVSVRAEMGSGGVHASVIPSSNDAAQVLNGHMTGLDAHLADQHLFMHPVTISVAEESRLSSDSGDGNQREYGGNTNQSNHQSSSDDRNRTDRSERLPTNLFRPADQGARELRALSANQLWPGGMYISLMA